MSSVSVPTDSLRAALEQALGAQYEVLRLLGRGGMGAVYLARERLLERLVAIKVLPHEHADGEARERFLREARTAALLSHPNIVPLLSFGEMSGTLFYIMRYIEGESLEARLKREGQIPPDEARVIISELADALTEAHRQGIVHRDLKPDNVMLDHATGRAMLTDFGIARHPSASSTLTGTGMIVGTPQYMSPEQAAGDRALDGRSDLYALGVIGYRMLTGRLPFSAEDVRELLMKQISSPPAPLTVVAPNVPLDLADGIMRCLEKDPAERWPDGKSLRFALQPNAADALVVPDSVETVPRIGTRTLGFLYVMSVGLVSLYAYTRDPAWLIADALLSAGSLVGILGTVVVKGIVSGIGWRRALRMAFWPGPRSSMWWPRSLRPPGDVFDQLPDPVRRGRIGQSVGVAVVGGVVVPMLVGAALAGDGHFALRKWLLLSGSILNVAAITGMLIPGFLSFRWRRAWNVTAAEASKLLTEPTHGSRFWERPSIAALLGKPRPIAATPMTVQGMTRAIADLASAFPSAASSLGRNAVDAAGQLARELNAIDARLAEMAGQADPVEHQRVRERLAALGAERADDSEMTRQMRTLLRGQDALFEQLATRLTELKERRERLLGQLRSLHLQMATYKAELGASGDHARTLTEKLDEITRHVGRHAAGTREVNDALRS